MSIRIETASPEIVAGSPEPQNAGHQLREGVMLITLADETARLIDIDGDSLAISSSGAMMLSALLSRPLDETCQTLARRFGVDEQGIREDCEDLVAGLVRRGVLMPPGDESDHRKRHLRWLSYYASTPLLIMCRQLPGRLILVKAFLLQAVAFVSVRWWGWPATMRVWMRALERGRYRPQSQDPAALEVISREIARAIAFHVLPVSCKERALSGLFLSRAAGFQSRLIVGMNTMPFELHCWCEYNDRIFADQFESFCERFVPMMTYS